MTACPKPEPKVLRDQWLEREAQKAKRAAWARVTKRDGRRCRACGHLGADHHHVLPRSLGGRDTDENLVLLCRTCHQYRHAGLLRIEGNANERLAMTFDARINDGETATIQR